MKLSAQAGSGMEYLSSDAGQSPWSRRARRETPLSFKKIRKGMGNPIKGFPIGPAKAGPQMLTRIIHKG